MSERPVVGSYELIKQIGEGGCARTYLGRHILLDDFACLKQNIEISAAEEEMLLREARLLWNVHHHSLPTLRDFLKVKDGSYVMVMTFVKGKDLFNVVQDDYPHGIDPEHVCWMAQRLLNALHYLHYHGVVHADVKPHNIIVKPKEHNAVLVDYGLSAIAPRKRTVNIGYTLVFKAPEQELGGPPPLPETDLYCLGLTMIYALGGDPRSGKVPISVPQELRDFIRCLVVHDIKNRPRTALELIKPLSNIREKLFGRRSSRESLVIS
ncbi:serine/threonine protein kinase [Patescibacteria group bacterium]